MTRCGRARWGLAQRRPPRSFALGAGSRFDVSDESDYTQCLIGAANSDSRV